jgi:uncharacterized SAM-binding protein YcdF (DUF218 family)
MNDGKLPQRPDAVIVLANLMDTQGQLYAESAARARLAVDIFKHTQAAYLVTCGWAYRDDSDIIIADAFKTHITTQFGLAPEMVIAEPNSRDTVGDAYFTKVNLAIPNAWKRICVVTSDYHVARTREIFEFVYGGDFTVEVLGAAAPALNTAAGNEHQSTLAFRTTFAGVERGHTEQILRALRERHPFYNGQIYEKI